MISTCPTCSGKLPLGSHISFNQFIGIECPGCKSVLTHKNYTFLVKVALLVAIVFSLSRLVDGNTGTEWILLFACSTVALIGLQLSFPLLVKYKPE